VQETSKKQAARNHGCENLEFNKTTDTKLVAMLSFDNESVAHKTRVHRKKQCCSESRKVKDEVKI
jgi:hypothetical protein